MGKMLKRLAVGAAVVAAGSLAAGCHFYRMAVARSPKRFLSDNPDLAGSGDFAATPASKERWLSAQAVEQVQIVSIDGLRLHGQYIPAMAPSRRIVILAHGYTSRGEHMASFARFYQQDLGFGVLLPDARGHGASEGEYIGFGWPDRLDYLRWIDYIVQRLGPETEIVLHGISMGAATVLMTAGEDLPLQVKAVVSDCAYSSAAAQLGYQMKRMYRLPSFPILPATSLVTKLRAGYFFSEASALDQVSRAKVPVLFIHGDADTFVPYSMVHQLYQACPTEKELYVVAGAGHGLAFRRDPERYIRTVQQFLNRHLGEEKVLGE